ncbi:MAG TPA: hypothetical protein VH396_22880 [Chitinophagaceae bacterium]|jgi:uncharacterized Tic20 family protein
MPYRNHYNDYFKNGHKLYEHAAYRHNADLPTREFVNWNISKVIWVISIILVVISIILFTSPHINPQITY